MRFKTLSFKFFPITYKMKTDENIANTNIQNCNQ